MPAITLTIVVDPSGRVAVFVRAPELGKVKTRLARALGDAAALQAYVELVEGTLQSLRGGAFNCELWFAGRSNEVLRRWRAEYGVPAFRQRGADLGERMLCALAAGAKAVVGSDIPALNAAYVEAALDRLPSADVVLGPVEDGGYCLIAMNETQPELFRSIEWSTGRVLEQTLSRATEAGLSVALLDVLWDVDEYADYLRWRKTLR